MKKLTTISVALLLTVSLICGVISSCTDLNEGPYSIATPNNALTQASGYTAFLAKLYTALSLSGQQGPAGDADLQGFDEGASSFLRAYWNVQELTTDEAIMRWGDQTVRELHRHDWTTSDIYIANIYARISYNIALSNEFLKEVNNQFPKELQSEKATYVAEARFIRALSYYLMIDLFRKGPLLTEPIDPKGTPPKENTTAELFAFVESELSAIENDLLAPGTQEWGRADRGAAWMLKAKLYLNAETYISAPKYTECLTYCKKIIDSGAFQLEPVYRYVFASDNKGSKEIIFPLPYDSKYQQSYGGITYLGRAPLNSSWGEQKADFGMIGAGWNGPTITPELADLFGPKADGKFAGTVNPAIYGVKNTNIKDDRYLFFTEEDNKWGSPCVRECDTDPYSWTQTEGYRSKKFLSLKKDGTPGSVLNDFLDNDFPMFRYADVLLMYAESVLRGAIGGSINQAVTYMNSLRTRANANSISQTDLTLDWILDERSRELWYEGHRRTDLVRFGAFTKKAWSWKGGTKQGRATDTKYNVFPIPASVRAANPNLTQNPGY